MSKVLPLSPRSSSVVRPRLLVEVDAIGALGRRIVAVLEADGMSVLNVGAAASATIRVVSKDLGRPLSLGHLRDELCNGGGARVVVVSPDCGPLGVRRAIRAGADSVVLEPQLEAVLVPAVRAVSVGLSAVPVLLRGSADRLALSYREREVLRLVIAGNTNSEIATSLFLAQSTVKSHLSSAYRKLGATNRKDAAALILDPDGGLLEMVLGPGQAPANGTPPLEELAAAESS
jgi:DNA-binding NarL/FixJ family response regulator